MSECEGEMVEFPAESLVTLFYRFCASSATVATMIPVFLITVIFYLSE